MRCLSIIAISAVLLQAQRPSTPPGVYRIGGGVSAPVPIEKPEPRYPEEARKANLQGTVVLFIVVGADGIPRDIKVIRPLGLGLSEEAVAAVQKWRFRPGKKEGIAVSVMATVEVNFRLPSTGIPAANRHWFITDLVFDVSPGSLAPRVAQYLFDNLPQLPAVTEFKVDFDIDIYGHPQNIEVTSDDINKISVAAQIRLWSFEPAQNAGAPIPAHATLKLVSTPAR
jgi:TonB family protein